MLKQIIRICCSATIHCSLGPGIRAHQHLYINSWLKCKELTILTKMHKVPDLFVWDLYIQIEWQIISTYPLLWRSPKTYLWFALCQGTKILFVFFIQVYNCFHYKAFLHLLSTDTCWCPLKTHCYSTWFIYFKAVTWTERR